jgi:hypothetical protein
MQEEPAKKPYGNASAAELAKLTVPPGAVGPPAPVSLTVALQAVVYFWATGTGLHESTVEVGRRQSARLIVPVLAEGASSPG